MGAGDARSISTGEELYSKGWRQGSLFLLPSVVYAWNRPTPPGAADPTECQIRRLKAKELLVVISQDCDIKFGEDREPWVEALICTHQTNPRILDGADSNSARWFLVDRARGLVADARLRVAIKKEALANVPPESWPREESSFRQFVRWLGRRYTRPAVPDEIVNAFQNPTEDAIKKLAVERPDIGSAFIQAVQEVRFKVLAGDSAPVVIQLIVLLKPDALTSEEAKALQIGLEKIEDSLDPTVIRLNIPSRLTTDDDLSVREYFDSIPLFLDYLSYKGEEIVGPEPYHPA